MERMALHRRAFVTAAAIAPTTGALPRHSARAQAANTIRVGVLCDMSGMYRDVTGPASIACARLAAQEFANNGFNVDVVFADNQNRPDIGSNIVR
jgi:branched-chain amino acid transport system substrate-binding protein